MKFIANFLFIIMIIDSFISWYIDPTSTFYGKLAITMRNLKIEMASYFESTFK